MVSAYRLDALKDATAALQEFYRDCKDKTSTSDFPHLVSKHYSNVFRNPQAFEEIPTLDVRNPPNVFQDRSLVRFRAMVQDTSLSSEMYLSRTADGRCGGWGIELGDEIGSSVDYANLRECIVLWAVSVPAETTWCAAELDGPRERQELHSLVDTGHPYVAILNHKYPNSFSSHIGVQVKIYDIESSERLRSTEIVTFVGILTHESANVGLDSVEVPTLHVLFMRRHSDALLSRSYPSSPTAEETLDSTNPPAGLQRTKELLISWIADEALGGDRDAAEWVLLVALARVQSRDPPLLPPSLTLTHFPSSPPVPSTNGTPPVLEPALSYILSQILPLMHTLPLSLNVLNQEPFIPESKDEDLHAGALQLPQGTVMLITEGGVREGKLIERGVLNIRALQEVMTAQTLAYAFPYSQFSFPTDLSCIVTCEGSRSVFFKTDINVPLKVGNSPEIVTSLYKPASSINMPAPVRLAAFRDLVVGARSGKVQVDEAASEYIQHDFVNERQRDQSVTSVDLIRQMTVAKLYALSLHETHVTVEIWKQAKSLDERRRASISVHHG